MVNLNKSIDLILAERLVSARKSKQINQKEMAQLLDISVASLNRYERALRQPDLDVLRNFAIITEKDINWFFEKSGTIEEDSEEMYRLKYERACEELNDKNNLIIELQSRLLESHSLKKARTLKEKSA